MSLDAIALKELLNQLPTSYLSSYNCAVPPSSDKSFSFFTFHSWQPGLPTTNSTIPFATIINLPDEFFPPSTWKVKGGQSAARTYKVKNRRRFHSNLTLKPRVSTFPHLATQGHTALHRLCCALLLNAKPKASRKLLLCVSFCLFAV